MKYQIENNQIVLDKSPDFNIFDICHCGQLFRYFEYVGYTEIVSTDKLARIFEREDKVVIECSDVQYFVNYFDLDTDYIAIQQKLKEFPYLRQAIEFGTGIRILRQNFFETMYSFIVSQNNNIKRIQNSLNAICRDFGESIGDNYSFPTPEKLRNADEAYYRSVGLGYRSRYLVEFVHAYTRDLECELRGYSTPQAKRRLMEFVGVGEKVADCILLFALNRQDVFPVDTWIHKVATEHFGMHKVSRHEQSMRLVQKFGNYSGYAQQYLFYYKREITRKNQEKKNEQ